jgi:hypothetical protein
MRSRDSLFRSGVHVVKAVGFADIDAVGFHRLDAANPLVEPMIPDQELGVMPWVIFHEHGEHSVMVSHKADPVEATVASIEKARKNAPTIGAPINVVAQKNDAGIGAAIIFDQFKCVFQHAKLAMYVPDSIDSISQLRAIPIGFLWALNIVSGGLPVCPFPITCPNS